MATINGETLTVEDKQYKIRYIRDVTKQVVVCDTDELQGEFGDEYPIRLITNFRHK